MRDALLVAAGGAFGSVSRWLVTGWVQRMTPSSAFPWGTFVVNVTGSFAIGLVATLATERSLLPPAARLLLVTGVLGGYTTLSALSVETLTLLRDGQWPTALSYALGTVVLGVCAAFAGFALASRL